MRAKGQKAHGKKESEVQDYKTGVKKREQITVTMETQSGDRRQPWTSSTHPQNSFPFPTYLAGP